MGSRSSHEMSSAMMNPAKQPALGALVGSNDVDKFISEFPSKFFVNHCDMTELQAILGAGALSSVAALCSVFKDSVAVWSPRDGDESRERYGDIVPAHEALSLYEAGHLVQFNAVERWVSPLKSMLRQLDEELGLLPGTATCSIFASTIGGGIPAHADPDPAFSIQLQGEKRWWIWPPKPSSDMESSSVPPPDATIVDVRPGTVMFIPKGYIHTTKSGKGSFAATFDFYIPTVGELISRAIRQVLTSDERFSRHAIDLRKNYDLISTTIQRLTPTVLELIASNLTDAERLASHLGPFVGSMQTYAVDASLNASVEQKADCLALALSRDGIGIADLELPLSAHSLVEWIIHRDAPFLAIDALGYAGDLEADSVYSILGALVSISALSVTENGPRG